MSDYSFSFSGSDCHTFVSFMSPSFYGNSAAAAKVKLDCINTISISVHEQRTPVRRLGHSGVVGFAGSVRTVAGSIIITIVKDNPFDELINKSNLRNYWTGRIQANDTGNETYKDIKHPYNYNNPKDSFEYTRTNNSPGSKFSIQNLTTLPAMKFRMEFVSEYYTAIQQPYRRNFPAQDRPLLRVMELHNVFIISENIVTSVNNMVTELVLQYVASDYVEFSEELSNEKIQSTITSQVSVPVAIKTEAKLEEQNTTQNPITPAPVSSATPVSVNATTAKKVDSKQENATTSTPVITAVPSTKTSSTNTTSENPSTTPTPKAEKPKQVKIGSVEIPVESQTNNLLALNARDKYYIKKIKDEAFTLDAELTTNIENFKKQDGFNLGLLAQYQAETAFSFNDWYKASLFFPDKPFSNSDDPAKQPDLSKENPFFAISAITEKNSSGPNSLFRDYKVILGQDAYEYKNTTRWLSTYSGNSSFTKAKLITKIKELIGNTPLEYDILQSKFKEAKQSLISEGVDGPINQYKNVEDLMIKSNSELMFYDRDKTSHDNFYKELKKHSELIPETLLPLYTENAKAYIYESIRKEYRLRSGDTVPLIDKHIDLYIKFLESTGQIQEGSSFKNSREILALKKAIERELRSQ